MFIAIYKNGEPLQRETSSEIFALPGEYYVFLKKDDNYFYFEDIDKQANLRFNHLEIIGFKYNLFGSTVEVFDHTVGDVKRVQTAYGQFPKIILKFIEELKLASEFPSFDSYLEFEQMKEENKSLKKENEKLKIQIKSLKQPNK